jgi:hypothetical protein
LLNSFSGFAPVFARGEHIHVRVRAQDCSDAMQDEWVIIGEHD